MSHRQGVEKGQAETLRAKQEVQVEPGECGISARRVDTSTELQQVTDEFEVAEVQTALAKSRIGDATNPVSRFFAKRRYAHARKKVGELYGQGEDIDYRLMH
jgi:hypothetical protein